MKTYYYSDELNDDFAGTNIKQKELPADYQYFSRNPLKKFFEFILYRLIVTPIIFLSQKLVFRVKIKNRRVLKGYKKRGYFLYANHTAAVKDAFIPTLVTFPKKAYIIINPDGVSIPVVGKAVEMLGGVPIPVEVCADSATLSLATPKKITASSFIRRRIFGLTIRKFVLLRMYPSVIP